MFGTAPRPLLHKLHRGVAPQKTPPFFHATLLRGVLADDGRTEISKGKE